MPQLLRILAHHRLQASFFFSLGPDNTGRALRRLFRRGFLAKIARTDVAGNYGLRTLGNGVLWPGPMIGRRNEAILRATQDAGHEVGIHCWDHVRWQDGLSQMSHDDVAGEFSRARAEFERIVGAPARAAAAAGWQASAHSAAVYDEAGLLYASDARGSTPFRARIGATVFRTPQIPTTLPTLDELLGRAGMAPDILIDRYAAWTGVNDLNVLTIHAELEGGRYAGWFDALLRRLTTSGTRIIPLRSIAAEARAGQWPTCDLTVGTVEGRSGTLAVQGRAD